jgi:Zn-dependent membrane protease YugP
MMGLEIALGVVGILIALVGMVSGAISLWLMVKYYKYNRRPNSIGLTGTEMARSILDKNGLEHIKVKRTGSLWFGNSYSHYFKKVRLRGFIRHETSLTSIGMGAQKAVLAILDKEGDPDMRKRIRLVPLVSFGPFAFLPILVAGVLLDFFIFNQTGICVYVCCGIGLLLYTYSLIFSILTLKTERKAQDRAYQILRDDYGVTAEELVALKELFHLYNIQYVNDIILSSLELLYRALQVVLIVKGGSDSSSSK